ncbi:rubredoxin [Streptomyces sp. NPDC051954]|uniref:rubredoxin n=1 Tax=unclassified Streptomyces TaxID=2593676 RepID=UPI00341C78BA
MSDLSGRTARRAWMCLLCGWVYYEELGAPEDGIPPGTRWEDVPEDWLCPECGAAKSDFVMEPL